MNQRRWLTNTCFVSALLAVMNVAGAINPLQEPQRRVQSQILTSTEMPAVRIEFDKKFKYAGTQTFVLYNVARAEQYFFVDADEKGAIKRLYWVQFEAYLPDNTHTYQYPVTKTVNVAGRDFIADAYARNIKENPGRPDSDGARARAFLANKGYHWGGEIISQRLVYLVDASKRAELMIIYSEDLSGMRLAAADFGPGGRAAAQWNEISKELLERALKGMKIK